jgi:two-component system CheB/CheR fusion protein
MEAYAPAAVLINHKHECLYSLGPTDRYLHVAPGHPTHDILAMVGQELRTKLRSAIQRAARRKRRSLFSAILRIEMARRWHFILRYSLYRMMGESLLLVCFLDEPEMKSTGHRKRPGTRRGLPS